MVTSPWNGVTGQCTAAAAAARMHMCCYGAQEVTCVQARTCKFMRKFFCGHPSIIHPYLRASLGDRQVLRVKRSRAAATVSQPRKGSQRWRTGAPHGSRSRTCDAWTWTQNNTSRTRIALSNAGARLRLGFADTGQELCWWGDQSHVARRGSPPSPFVMHRTSGSFLKRASASTGSLTSNMR